LSKKKHPESITVLGKSHYSKYDLECVKKRMVRLGDACNTFELEDRFLIVNLRYLLVEHETFRQQLIENTVNTHVICLILNEKYTEPPLTDYNMYIHKNKLYKEFKLLIAEHIRQISRHCIVHFVTSFPEAENLATEYLGYAKIKKGIETCIEIRSQIAETNEEIFKYLLASHSLIKFEKKYESLKRQIINYPLDNMDRVPVKIKSLIKSRFLKDEANVSVGKKNEEDIYFLIISCCSAKYTTEFLTEMELIKDIESNLFEFSNCHTEPKKTLKKKIFIQNDCFVSGFNNDYIFFRSSLDNMPFSLSKKNFVAKVVFEYGEFFPKGYYIGDGVEAFLQVFDHEYEVDPIHNGICTKSFQSDFYKDLQKKQNCEFAILLLTESNDFWMRAAESWRLSLLQVFNEQKIDRQIIEFNFCEKHLPTQELEIEISHFKANDIKQSIYGTYCNKSKLSIIEQLNLILKTKRTSNIVVYK